MARTRINKKFVVVAVCTVLVLGVAASAYKFRRQLFYPAPETLVQRAKQKMEEGDYKEAGKLLYKAGEIKRTGDPLLYVLLGDVHDHLAADSNENFGKARSFWETALSADPLYLPAMQRLLARAKDYSEAVPIPGSFEYLRETAQRMLLINPDDKQAQFLLHRATIDSWRNGGEVPRASVDESIQAMEKIFQEDPSNADAFFMICAARLQRAGDAFRANDDETARRISDEIGAFAQTSVQAQPNNGQMHIRAGQVYSGLEGFEKRLKRDPKKYDELAEQHLLLARDLVKPDDENYIEVQLSYASSLMRKKESAAAEKLLRDLCEQKPDDLQPLLALAEVVGSDQKRFDEAIALLNRPLPDMSKRGGVFALKTMEMEKSLIAAEIRMRLGLAARMEGDQREEELQRIERLHAKLQSKTGETGRVLALKGRIQFARNKPIDAIQSLEASLRAAGQAAGERYQTMELLAQAYRATGQPGQAKRHLTEVVKAFEEELQPRILLAEMLLQERNIKDATPHVEIITKTLPPDSPIALKMRIAVMDKETQGAERQKLFAQLPQNNRAEIMDKALFAMQYLDEEAAGVKLLESLRAANPADFDVVLLLAQHYVNKKDKEQAERIVAEALVKAPDNVQLQLTQKRLQADTLAEAQSVNAEAVQNITDPFRKELRLFELALTQNKPDEARAHLANAEKLRPEDPTVLDLLYQFYVGKRDFAEAERYLARLAKADPSRGEIARVAFAMAKKDIPQALELAKNMTRQRGEFAKSWLVLADVQSSQGNYADAITNYRAALDRDSRNLDAMRGLINAYYRTSNPEEAKRFIEMARRIFPNHLGIRDMALDHEVFYGDPEQAIAPRQELLDKDKENPGNWFALGQTYAAAARAKLNTGKDPEGQAMLKKAMETFQGAYAKWPDDQRFAVAIGEMALKQQKFEEGEKALRALMDRPAYKDRSEPLMMLAQFHSAAGKHAEAEKIYRQVLEKTGDLGVQVQLAEMLFRQKRIDDALAVLALHNTEDPVVRRQKVELLVRAGRLDDAQKELDGMLASGNPSASLLDLQGMVFMESNRQAEALAALNKALTLDPRYAPALFRRGILRMTRGDLNGAVEDLSAARELVPGFVDARIRLAEAIRYRGDLPAAVRELEYALRDQPADKNLRLKLVDFYAIAVPPRWLEAEQVFRDARNIPALAKDPDVLQAEARMWSQRNDPQKALAKIQEAAKLAPTNLSIAQTLFDVLIKAKAYREVLAASDQILKSDPKIAWVHEARGIARARMGDKDAALADFETALQLANDQRDESGAMRIVTSMGAEVGFAAAMRRVEPRAQSEHRWQYVALLLCRSQNNYHEALRWANIMLNDPKLPELHRDNVMRIAGDMYCSLTPPDYDKALELFKQLVIRSPEDPAVLNNLAAVMTMPGSPARPEDAVQYSEKAYRLSLHAGALDPAILDTHGSILVLVGRIDEGISLLQQSLERRALPDTYYHLGDAYLRQSKPEEADQMLRNAKELLAQAERNRQPVDPTLRQQIEDALLRASAMKSAKAESPG